MKTQSPLRRGFTLIELLVVIAIIGLLSTLAVVALNSARQRSRDAKRAADIRQMQTALELGFSENGEYPSDANVGSANKCGNAAGESCSSAVLGNTGSASATILCKSSAGPFPIFTNSTANCATGGIYMGLVPAAPTPPSTQTYFYCSGCEAGSPAAGSAYKILFTLEGNTGQLQAGANCANSSGIQAGVGC